MKREKFIELMRELVSIKEAEHNLNTAFKAFEPDFNFICFGRYETLFVNCIKEAMNDYNDWIGYWLYELNCGKNAKKNSVQYNNGKCVPIKTLDNLYEIIINKKL